jgi:uncharacterized protein YbcC (UPF0753/DUF2309 family)
MSAGKELPIRERLGHWLDLLAHVLPAQAPIRDFVHHNTLHGFQHLSFPEALAAAHRLSGARTYWPESRFLQCLASGRITGADLSAALDDAGVERLDVALVRALTRRDVLIASLLVGDAARDGANLAWSLREGTRHEEPLLERCAAVAESLAQQAEARDGAMRALEGWEALVAQVGERSTWRSLLAYLSGEDVLERTRVILQRHLAAHLDLGVAAWRNPAREQGFYAAWRASAGFDLAWEMDELPNVRDEILHLPDNPVDLDRKSVV